MRCVCVRARDVMPCPCDVMSCPLLSLQMHEYMWGCLREHVLATAARSTRNVLTPFSDGRGAAAGAGVGAGTGAGGGALSSRSTPRRSIGTGGVLLSARRRLSGAGSLRRLTSVGAGGFAWTEEVERPPDDFNDEMETMIAMFEAVADEKVEKKLGCKMSTCVSPRVCFCVTSLCVRRPRHSRFLVVAERSLT
jgi:hypothetical protein